MKKKAPVRKAKRSERPPPEPIDEAEFERVIRRLVQSPPAKRGK